jgi:hypothetical protein
MASGNTLTESASTLFISYCSGLSCMGGWAVPGAAELKPPPGVRSGMEQRRFFEVRGEESGEWLVLDAKRHPPRVICRCHGWNAPKNAALIVAALEAHNSELYAKFPLEGSERFNEQSALNPYLPSGEGESAPTPKPAARKPRAERRG